MHFEKMKHTPNFAFSFNKKDE